MRTRSPTARAERHTLSRRQPSCARVARAGDSLCADTWTAPLCVCPLSNIFPIGVREDELIGDKIFHPPAGTRAGPPAPGRGRVGTRPRSRSHRAGTSHDRYRRELPTRRARPHATPPGPHPQRPGAPPSRVFERNRPVLVRRYTPSRFSIQLQLLINFFSSHRLRSLRTLGTARSCHGTCRPSAMHLSLCLDDRTCRHVHKHVSFLLIGLSLSLTPLPSRRK